VTLFADSEVAGPRTSKVPGGQLPAITGRWLQLPSLLIPDIGQRFECLNATLVGFIDLALAGELTLVQERDVPRAHSVWQMARLLAQ
jgi:hypothetical protein